MKRILQPVIENIPLFLISILLMGGFDAVYQQHLFHENTSMGILTGYMEIIFMAYMICLISYLCRKIYLKVLFYIVLFMLYGLSCYLLYAYSAYITPNILLLLFETNSKEVTGFFQTYLMTPAMFKSFVIVGFLLVLTIVGEIYNKRISRIASKPACMWGLSAVLLLGAIGSVGVIKRYWNLSQSKTAYDAECWKSSHLFYKVMPVPNFCYSVMAIYMAGQDIYYMVDATKESLESTEPVESDSLNIVLVIGESFNKYHAQLYGYSLPTTPNQCEEQSRGNLYAYTHVKAPHNMTSVVLKNMFCCNNVHEGERWHNFPFFPALFKKAGYDAGLAGTILSVLSATGIISGLLCGTVINRFRQKTFPLLCLAGGIGLLIVYLFPGKTAAFAAAIILGFIFSIRMPAGYLQASASVSAQQVTMAITVFCCICQIGQFLSPVVNNGIIQWLCIPVDSQFLIGAVAMLIGGITGISTSMRSSTKH